MMLNAKKHKYMLKFTLDTYYYTLLCGNVKRYANIFVLYTHFRLNS